MDETYDGGDLIRRRRGYVKLAFGLTVANLVTFFVVALLTTNPLSNPALRPSPMDVWGTLLLSLVLQAAVTGLLLLLDRSTRPVGLGLLAGAASVAGISVAYLLFLGATLGS